MRNRSRPFIVGPFLAHNPITLKGFFHELTEALRRGPVALATVVAARGSTPRIAGARQFLGANGASHGTIGGGATEARVRELARETLADGRPRTVEADLRGRPGAVRDGICGGTMTVWIVRLDPGNHHEFAESIAISLQAGKRFPLSLRLDAEAPLDREAADDAFHEILEPPPRLLIVGAGHIGRSLARLASELDFAVAVQDERRDWLTPDAFPEDCALERDLAAAVGALQAWEGERFAALVTRGFALDVAALNALSPVPHLAYLGLLGSRTRVATVLATQRESGNPPPPAGALHAPIGFEIGAETPEEIAVSIAAEIIQVRRALGGGHRRENP